MLSPLHERTDLLGAGLLIGDSWQEESSRDAYEHVNPTTGRPQKMFPLAGQREVDAAVDAARAALPAWRRRSAAVRSSASQS